MKEIPGRIPRQGYALDLEEFSRGLIFVAFPIYNYSNREIGAISVSGPTHRIREKQIESLIPPVTCTARGDFATIGVPRPG
jgi:IclR family KDG regulon transcriptional repressor